jgi:hypothetical protein
MMPDFNDEHDGHVTKEKTISIFNARIIGLQLVINAHENRKIRSSISFEIRRLKQDIADLGGKLWIPEKKKRLPAIVKFERENRYVIKQKIGEKAGKYAN